jgi:hypothetical protein
MKSLRSLIPDETRLSNLYSRIIEYRERWGWISRILVIGAFVFIAILLVQSWPQIRAISWRSYIPIFLISLGIYALSLLLQMSVWLHMLSFQHKISWQDIEIYSQTVVMRRIPGGIWHWVGRSTSYLAESDVGLKRILLANFLEWTLIIVTAGIVYAIFATEISLLIRSMLFVISVALGIALANTWFPKNRGLVRRTAHALYWLLAFSCSWILGGVILFLLFDTGDYSGISFAQSVSVWSLAGGVSALTIVAPSGFGIQELSLGILLSPFAPLSYVILIALLLRLIFTVADVVWGSGGWLLSHALLEHQRVKSTVRQANSELPTATANQEQVEESDGRSVQ